jgi:hypothetical protein
MCSTLGRPTRSSSNAPNRRTTQKFTARAEELAAAGKLRYVHATDLKNGALDPDFCPAKNIDAILVRPREFGKDSNPNNNSVVIRLNYNDQTFLFPGDAEAEEEEALLNDPASKALLGATVLKAGHHGSNTSSTQAFLDTVQPKIVVVSVGEKNVGTNKGYKHPRTETIARFLTFTRPWGDVDLRTIDAYDTASKQWKSMTINAGLYVTQIDGTITVSSDGHKTWKEGASTSTAPDQAAVRYVYSKNSNLYHFAECADAKRIKPENRVTSAEPPPDKELHAGCPR